MLKKLLLQIHGLLLFFLLNPLVRAGENDIKIIEIEKPITLINGALRQILIQKNNIKNYDNIDVKLNESLNISIEEKTKKLCRIVYSKVKENDIMEVFIDDDCDGFLDLKIVYKNNIKIEEYHITHSFKKVEKSKGVSLEKSKGVSP